MMKIGMGYDMHGLARGRQMVLGGVKIPCVKGPKGHSDGDVLLHAICDAVLGALGRPDIGERFPDTEAKYKDISSAELLRDVASLMDSEGFGIGNLDCVVVTEEPRVADYREKMTRLIGDILKAPAGAVNVKGKTSEKLGIIGEGKAIAAYAVVLLKEKI
ncbi:MAG: 2-C-methyl-D-erythritol 2,4-cyclodiphosphate synthase [Candidatus Omnitrophota bacterium]